MWQLLNLCCGMGGWSIGFYRSGFECTGVDILDLMYPYELIQADVREWHCDRQFDVVVASPPCTEFSTLTRLAFHGWQDSWTKEADSRTQKGRWLNVKEAAKNDGPNPQVKHPPAAATAHPLKLLAVPVLILLWLIGWPLYLFGKRKKETSS